MEDYLTVEFESSSDTTPQFASFARKYKNAIKKQLEAHGFELVEWIRGHFYCSGFAKKSGKYIYFSCSDVRYFSNGWYDDLLVRTAEHDKDYTGGSNNWATLNTLGEVADKLVASKLVEV